MYYVAVYTVLEKGLGMCPALLKGVLGAKCVPAMVSWGGCQEW